MRFILMLAPICLTLGCMSTPTPVTRNHWYTCEYLCFTNDGLIEAVASEAGKECICGNGFRYPYPDLEEDDKILEEFINSIDEGKK